MEEDASLHTYNVDDPIIIFLPLEIDEKLNRQLAREIYRNKNDLFIHEETSLREIQDEINDCYYTCGEVMCQLKIRRTSAFYVNANIVTRQMSKGLLDNWQIVNYTQKGDLISYATFAMRLFLKE